MTGKEPSPNKTKELKSKSAPKAPVPEGPEAYKQQMAERRKKSIEGRQKKQVYNRLKKETLDYEVENFSKLYVLKAQDGWYKMFDNSAYIYTYELAPRFSKLVTIHSDTDFNFTAKRGVVSLKDFEGLKAKLAELKIKLVHDDDNIAIFHLGYSIPPERMNGYFAKDEEARQSIEKLLVAKNVFPILKQRARDLNETVWNASQKMSPWNKEVIGYEITKETKWIYHNFIMMARGWKDADAYFPEAQIKLENLRCSLAIIEEMRILENEKIYTILYKIAGVEQELISSYSQYSAERSHEKAERKAEAEGRKLAKQSETRKQVAEKAINGTKPRAAKNTKPVQSGAGAQPDGK
ncbi:hypothetical protein IJ090_03680 [Candidatus Saccharibacteria bacterium]|nr:hypothetical protein [Candidatus Saccharibacteria bacterium]